MTQQTTDANDTLMGGGGAPSAKFETEGTTWEGKVLAFRSHEVREYDPNNPGGGPVKKYPSGDTIMGVTVDIATDDRDIAYEDDDGVRRVYVEGRYIKEAVRNAVKAAGAKGLEVGGYLKVTFTHREDPMDKRSRKFWDVVYTPAGNAALMGSDSKITATGMLSQSATPATYSTATAPKPSAYITPGQQDTAKQLLNVPGLTDDQIAAASGLTVGAVATLRAQTNDPPF